MERMTDEQAIERLRLMRERIKKIDDKWTEREAEIKDDAKEYAETWAANYALPFELDSFGKSINYLNENRKSLYEITEPLIEQHIKRAQMIGIISIVDAEEDAFAGGFCLGITAFLDRIKGKL